MKKNFFLLGIISLIPFIFFTYKLNKESQESARKYVISNSDCRKNLIWTKLDNCTYFKRDSFFYLIDYQSIRFSYISYTNISTQFVAEIYLINKKESKKFILKSQDLDIQIFVTRHTYTVYFVNIKFNAFNPERIKIVFQSDKKFTEPINVKIRYVNNPNKYKKNSIILCSKCFFYRKSYEILNLKWWLDINSALGYNKISICENSIDDRIYLDYKHLEIESIKCVPNFLNSNSEHITSFYDFIYNRQFDYSISDVVHLQVINQCFLKHAEKVKFISIFDNDEIILPRKDPKYFKISDYRNFVLNSKIDNYDQIEKQMNMEMGCNRYGNNSIKAYINEIKDLYKIKPIQPIYFYQGIYLRYETVQNLLEKISTNLFLKNETRFTLVVSTNNIPHLSNNTELYFTFDDQQDIEYAKKLLDLNEKYYKIFIRKNEHRLKNLSDNFQRLFAIIDERGRLFSNGKSVHFTNYYIPLCMHSICQNYALKRKILTDDGHVSHFRQEYKFGKTTTLSIRQIIFDINYLNCFVKPFILKF